MACNVEACAECTQKCLWLHGNKTKSAPVIVSFFKIMIGSQCNEVLFFPPKFAPTVSEFIDQKTFLEDSSGQQWEVTISSVNGSFAFCQGWNTFFLDHKLKVGDFVVFNYIVGSFFLVRIYTDTGCEKLDFPENRNKRKRPRAYENYTARDGPSHTIDTSPMTKQVSSASVVSGSDAEVTQSQCKMNDVGEVNVKVTSNFEMLTNNRDTDKSHKGDEIYTQHADVSPKSQIEATLANKDPEGQDVVNRVVPSNASDLELMETSSDLKRMDKIVTVSDKISCDKKFSVHSLFTTVVKPAKNGKSIPNTSNGVVKKDLITEEQGQAEPEIQNVIKSRNKYTYLTQSNQSAQPKFTGKLEYDVPVTYGMLNSQLGKSMKMVKEELIELTGELCRDKKMNQGKAPQINEVDCGQRSDSIVRKSIAHPLVKMESLEFEAISCVIASADEPFLELPSCLPYLKFRFLDRFVSRGRNVVYLRDPYMRIWPVLYLETSEFKLLSSGWEEFSKANNIKAGDECIFGVDYNHERTCEVDIVRRQTSAPIVPLRGIE